MNGIKSIKAREVLDSRGIPTLEVDCWLEDRTLGWAIVPSGTSAGKNEALELRDGDARRFLGQGVLKAVKNVNEIIAPALVGMDANQQTMVDRKLIALDGSENKSILSANAILGVSMSVCRAAATSSRLPLYQYIGGLAGRVLPVPFLNVINGGAHAGWNLDFQEYHIVPAGYPTFAEALRAGAEIFQYLRKILKDKGLFTGVGHEGGFAPTLRNNEEPLGLILKAIEMAGYKPGEEVYLALDCAASGIFDKGKYELKLEKKRLTSDELIDLYESWIRKYPIISIEDGLDENDWTGWISMTARLGSKIQVVGDDVFVTNIRLLKKAISEKAANAILIKLNQIGTVTETLECHELANVSNFNTIISHRSGETEDTFIADLAVGINAGQIKTGAPCRSERTAKYNQLLRIEEEAHGVFLGKQVFQKA